MPFNTHKYSNNDITVIWKPNVCIHSTLCWKGLAEVFNPKEKPWIKMEGASTQKIMEQVSKCPSGALSFEKNEKVSNEQQPTAATQENIIECLPNGPLLINGKVIVKKSDGTEEIKNGTIALCRCGASKNKPYCDGNHRAIGFTG
jgi:uncharacterized Fe-S cluster protein YjdI